MSTLNSQSLLEKLKKQVSDLKQPNRTTNKDDRFWSPTVDASGAGSAVLRFLPGKTDEDTPFTKTYRHVFQIGKSWFIDNCPTTIHEQCPICDSNTSLHKTGLEADKKKAAGKYRKTEYIVNALIVKDPGNKENEGQVKLFRFGPKIWEKVEEAFNPHEDSGEEAFNPFSLEQGANFNLRIAMVADYRNYDKSKFVSTADVSEERKEEIMTNLHDLSTFTAQDQFKSYDELRSRFLKVMGEAPINESKTTIADDDDEEFETTAAPKEVGAVKKESAQENSKTTTEVDDDLAFLTKLANDTDLI